MIPTLIQGYSVSTGWGSSTSVAPAVVAFACSGSKPLPSAAPARLSLTSVSHLPGASRSPAVISKKVF